ncbi:MAG: leucine-rich repeat domain-containing protein [Clostridiales bacterium]|nr:leucine-rich repeat domain-containing protein [Clostridiales bacterium]
MKKTHFTLAVGLILLAMLVLAMSCGSKGSNMGASLSNDFQYNDITESNSRSDFKYIYDDTVCGIVIIEYVGSGGKVQLPAMIEGKPVVKIGNNAFWGNTSIKEVYIPDSVVEFGNAVFAFCTSLRNVTMPNNVAVINDCMFQGCKRLMDITIPDGVVTIGERAFLDCKELTSITIPDSVTSIGESAFARTGLANVDIPISVTSIGNGAFNAISADFFAIYNGEVFVPDQQGNYFMPDAFYDAING